MKKMWFPIVFVSIIGTLYAQDIGTDGLNRFRNHKVVLSQNREYSGLDAEIEIAAFTEKELVRIDAETDAAQKKPSPFRRMTESELQSFKMHTPYTEAATPGIPVLVRNLNVPTRDDHAGDFFYFVYDYDKQHGVVRTFSVDLFKDKKGLPVKKINSSGSSLLQEFGLKQYPSSWSHFYTCDEVKMIAEKLNLGPLNREPIAVSLTVADGGSGLWTKVYWYFETTDPNSILPTEFLMKSGLGKLEGGPPSDPVDYAVQRALRDLKGYVDSIKLPATLSDSDYRDIQSAGVDLAPYYKNQGGFPWVIKEKLSLDDRIALLDELRRPEKKIMKHPTMGKPAYRDPYYQSETIIQRLQFARVISLNYFDVIVNPKTPLHLYDLDDRKKKDPSLQWRQPLIYPTIGEILLRLVWK